MPHRPKELRSEAEQRRLMALLEALPIDRTAPLPRSKPARAKNRRGQIVKLAQR